MRFKVPGGRFLDVVDGMRTSYIASKMAPENGGCLLSEIWIPSPEWQMRTFCWVKKGSYGRWIWMIMENQRSISRHIEGEWYLTNDKLKKKHR